MAAAGIGSRAAAWPMFFVTVVLITMGRLVDTVIGPTGLVLTVGALLAGVGFLRSATREEMRVQTLGLVGFGATALLATQATPLRGAYLTAVGLLAHAAWDGFHHYVDRVVPRSFARFCAVLNYTLAAIILSLTTLTAVS